MPALRAITGSGLLSPVGPHGPTLQTKLHNKLHNKSTSQLDLKLQQVASDFRKSQQLVEQLNVQLDSLEFATWVEGSAT